MIGVLIASTILVLSAAGLMYVVGKKFPLLATYPAQEEGSSPREMAQKVVSKIQDSKALQLASPDMILQNLLSKTRIVAMKTESKTGQMLERMRKESKERNGNPKFSDDYWKKLKKKKV